MTKHTSLLLGLSALAFTLPLLASQDKSACNANSGTTSDMQSLDETSMLQTTGQVMSRAKPHVPASNNRSGRLLMTKRVDMSDTNLIMVRIAKTASTTCCEISRRIAMHHNLGGVFVRRGWPGDIGEPGVWAAHGALGTEEDFGPNTANEPVEEADSLPSWTRVQELEKPYFMWTVLRDPARRALSQYYWRCDHLFQTPTTEGKVKYLTEEFGGNNQFRYIRPTANYTIQEVLDTYGVIALTERLEESLVVLAATLKIPLSDVLYFKASKNSSEDYMDGYSHVVIHAHPDISQEPPEVQEVLANQFQVDNAIDYEFYAAANATLDRKIEEMNLYSQIEVFRKFLAKAQDHCYVEHSPMTPVEDITDCIVDDQGCNYKCLDRFRQQGLDMCEWCGDEM